MTEYYIQDSRSYSGNDMIWWREGGGYTSNLLDAEKFLKPSAYMKHVKRSTDIPWPVKYIQTKIRPTVDMQYCNIKEALKGTGMKLIKPKKIPKPKYRCNTCGKFMSAKDYYSLEYGCNKCLKVYGFKNEI